MVLEPEALYQQLIHLAATFPDLVAEGERGSLSTESKLWLGRCEALVIASGDTSAELHMLHLSSSLLNATRRTATEKIGFQLYRAIARVEVAIPLAAQGAFIGAGQAFDALAAVGKVLGKVATDALIVDPYMDEKVLTEFALTMPQGPVLRLLGDQKLSKESLAPAAKRWVEQYGSSRPLEVRLAAERSLHDRLLLVDFESAWVLTQSLKDFATRSPASILRADREVAQLKIAAYADMWDHSTALS